MTVETNWAFWTALAAVSAIGYVLAGYPLLLAFLARRSRPSHAADIHPTVSVILPVRNGAPWLADKLESILQQSYPAGRMEILVVSDASDDNTDEIAAGFSAQGVHVARLPRGGKAAALNYAIPRMNSEVLLLTDVRQKLAPDCLQRLVSRFADPDVGVVSGDLVILSGKSAGEASTGLYWRYETWIRHNLSAVDSLLGATGPIYAIRRKLAVSIPSETLLDDVYLPMMALRQGYRLILEPRAKAYDFPTSLASEFRRKVRTQAGIYQLLRLAPWMFTPANRVCFHFLSLKVGRLLLPFFLLLLAFSTPFLPSLWLFPAAAGQIGFYSLAALDDVVSEGNTLKRLTAPARAFVVLILAALRAVSVFFVDPRSLWRETVVGEAAVKR